MVKSVNMQLKSKDIDIQRLNIKIKRLEKTKELADELAKPPITSPRATAQATVKPPSAKLPPL
jgi:hypothetical protein